MEMETESNSDSYFETGMFSTASPVKGFGISFYSHFFCHNDSFVTSKMSQLAYTARNIIITQVSLLYKHHLILYHFLSFINMTSYLLVVSTAITCICYF